MKNNNAIISDIIQALEDQLTLKAIDGKLCKSATARTKRQDAKQVFGVTSRVTLTFVHPRWAGDYQLVLRNILDEGIVVINSTLPGDCTATVFRIILTRKPSKEAIETESEIIKGCTLLGAKYLGEGKLRTACGVTFQIPLDKPVTAQKVRDAVICDLAWNINKKPQIGLTRI